ncbi:11828_t:CDS:2 [Gigaspora margarita]|uniref:11828_t:CDS:1 n=1 Tax=Gigaspora margarita TaxID=4874 RepID=A0ABM8W3P8_GIGMA|nr:11828_t:CDS:2 [Gigaspora margarita]
MFICMSEQFNNKNGNRRENSKRINKTFNGKAIPIKNNALPTFQTNNRKFENPPESNSKIGMIKSIDETSNNKDNLEMITTWVNNANKIVHGEVATVINDKKIRYEIAMPMTANNGKSVIKEMNYGLLSRFKNDIKHEWHRPEEQKSCDMSPVSALNMLDRIGKRGFYKRIYLDHVIGIDGIEHAIFESRINMRMRGNSSTEWNDLSNCCKNRSGGVMSVGNNNIKGYSNNTSICDHEFADDGKVDGMIDNKHQNDEAIVLMEAPLNVVMKMDTMMEGLLEMLRRW